MNNNIDDGGPAFPLGEREGFIDDAEGGKQRVTFLAAPGMSLRDWFAGQALAGFMGDPDTNGMTPEKCARWAYDIADAMLAERKRGGGS